MSGGEIIYDSAMDQKAIMQIKAIGWDVDGTLFPLDAIPQEMMLNMMIAKVAEVNDWSLSRAEEEFSIAYEETGSRTKALNKMGVDGVGYFVEMWERVKLKKYLKEDTKLIELFDRLDRFRNFIISNSNTTDKIEEKINLVGLSCEIFEFSVPTVKLGAVKPDPKPFLVALERLKLKPEQVLYVGDRVKTDIEGAKAVGMKTCLVWSSSCQGVADFCCSEVYGVADIFDE